MVQRVPATTKAPEVPWLRVAKKKYPVVFPYVRGISEQLRKVFRSFDIPAYFKLINTLQQLLVQPKDTVAKGKVVGPVYHITCDDCDAMYVGETSTERSLLETQFSEHRRKSSVGSEVSQYVHVDRPEHGVSLDKVKILTAENRKFEKGVKEAIYIRASTRMACTIFFQQCGLTC